MTTTNHREASSKLVVSGCTAILLAFPLLAFGQTIEQITGEPADNEFLYVTGSGLSGAEAFVCTPQKQQAFSDRGGFVKLDTLHAAPNLVELQIRTTRGTVTRLLSDTVPWPPRNTTRLTWEAPTETTEGEPLQLGGFRLRYADQVVEIGADDRAYLVEGLVPGDYTFSLSAVDSDGVEGEALSVGKNIP